MQGWGWGWATSPGGTSKLVTDLDRGYIKAIIYPHIMFRHVFRAYEQDFKIRMGADPDRIQWFWKELRATKMGESLWKTHPELIGKEPADLRFCIPLTGHADGAPYTKKGSATFVSWGAVLGTGNELETRFLSFSFPDRHQEGGEVGWKTWFWSFAALARGVMPASDPDGNQWPEGSLEQATAGEALCPTPDGNRWSGVLVFLKGDRRPNDYSSARRLQEAGL